MEQRPKHGAKRNQSLKTTTHYMETNVGLLPASSFTRMTAEMYCGCCQKWVLVEHIVDRIITPCCNQAWSSYKPK